MKKCKVANYCKQIKQIVDKVDDNTKFINNRRKSANIKLSDTKAVVCSIITAFSIQSTYSSNYTVNTRVKCQLLIVGGMGERMQGSWYTAGQILQQLEKATRCRTSAPDRTERPCKTYHLSNSNNYILNSVKSTFHTFPFE